MNRQHVLERSQIVPRPRPEVFAFFAEARNLEAITPDFLHFEMLPPVPLQLRPGSLIDYRLRLFGIPFRWRTRIEVFEPNLRFVDVQLRGPYHLWHHTHTFEDAPEGTLVRDRVVYALPLGALGGLVRPLLVAPTLDRIFDHRRERIAALIGGRAAAPPAPAAGRTAPGASPAGSRSE
jgi:ligand-binding SRPBCC domain-containing protein